MIFQYVFLKPFNYIFVGFFSMSNMNEIIKKNQITLFFTITLLIGWAPWLLGKGYIVFAAPTIASFIVAGAVDGKEGIMKILRRLAKWKTLPIGYIVALLAPLFTSGVAIGIHSLLGGTLPAFPLFSSPMMLLMAFIMFMLPWQSSAFMEEIGFRGYAMEELQDRMGSLKGTLVLGFFFGAWLLPEFFNEGSAQYSLGLGYYPWFILTEIGFSLIMTWVYNKSGKSAFVSGYLMHVAMNFWSFVMLTNIVPGQSLPALDLMLWKLTSVVVACVGLGVVVSTKGTLGKPKKIDFDGSNFDLKSI
jgi:membrane protease YdiL (CAAX protease family)